MDTYYRKWLRTVPPGKWSAFHMDNAAITANVALSPEADLARDGGALLGIYGGSVHAIPRAMGEATVHTSSLLHGVTRMRVAAEHARYSMILFYGRRAEPE